MYPTICSVNLLFPDHLFSFFLGVGVCALEKGDRKDGACDQGHVFGEGHTGVVPERGFSLH